MRVFGIVIMVVAAVALVVPVLLDSGWSSKGSAATEPMQLTGAWLGMRLDATDSPIARELGVPPVVKGVVVTQLLATPGARAALAGLAQGDVLTGIDGKPIGNLAELYALSTSLDTTKDLKVDVLRQGRTAQLVLTARSLVAPQIPVGNDTTATYGVPVVAR
jgi:S1-C subfamily serine protease